MISPSAQQQRENKEHLIMAGSPTNNNGQYAPIHPQEFTATDGDSTAFPDAPQHPNMSSQGIFDLSAPFAPLDEKPTKKLSTKDIKLYVAWGIVVVLFICFFTILRNPPPPPPTIVQASSQSSSSQQEIPILKIPYPYLPFQVLHPDGPIEGVSDVQAMAAKTTTKTLQYNHYNTIPRPADAIDNTTAVVGLIADPLALHRAEITAHRQKIDAIQSDPVQEESWVGAQIPQVPKPTRVNADLSFFAHELEQQDLLQKRAVEKTRNMWWHPEDHLLPTMPIPLQAVEGFTEFNWSIIPLPQNKKGYRFLASKRIHGADKTWGLPPEAEPYLKKVQTNSQVALCYADFVQNKTAVQNNTEHFIGYAGSQALAKGTPYEHGAVGGDAANQLFPDHNVNAFHPRITDLNPTPPPPPTGAVYENIPESPYTFGCVSPTMHNLDFDSSTLKVALNYVAGLDYERNPRKENKYYKYFIALGNEDGRLFLDRCGRILLAYGAPNDEHPDVLEQVERHVAFVDARRFIPDLPITILPTPECLEEEYLYMQQYTPLVDYHLWAREQKEKKNDGKLETPPPTEQQPPQALRKHGQRFQAMAAATGALDSAVMTPGLDQVVPSKAELFPAPYNRTAEQPYPLILPQYKEPKWHKNWLPISIYGVEGVQYAHNMAVLYHNHLNRASLDKMVKTAAESQQKEKEVGKNPTTTTTTTTPPVLTKSVAELRKKYPVNDPTTRLDKDPRAMLTLVSSTPHTVALGKHLLYGTLDRRPEATQQDPLMQCAQRFVAAHAPFPDFSFGELREIHGATNPLLFRLTRDEYFGLVNTKLNPEYEGYVNDTRNMFDTKHPQYKHNQDYYYVYAHIVHLRPPRSYLPTIVFLDAQTMERIAIIIFEINNTSNLTGGSHLGLGKNYQPPHVTYAHSWFANKTPWTLNPSEMNSPMIHPQSYTLADQIFVSMNHGDNAGVIQELNMARMWEKRFLCKQPEYFIDALLTKHN